MRTLATLHALPRTTQQSEHEDPKEKLDALTRTRRRAQLFSHVKDRVLELLQQYYMVASQSEAPDFASWVKKTYVPASTHTAFDAIKGVLYDDTDMAVHDASAYGLPSQIDTVCDAYRELHEEWREVIYDVVFQLNYDKDLQECKIPAVHVAYQAPRTDAERCKFKIFLLI